MKNKELLPSAIKLLHQVKDDFKLKEATEKETLKIKNELVEEQYNVN